MAAQIPVASARMIVADNIGCLAIRRRPRRSSAMEIIWDMRERYGCDAGLVPCGTVDGPRLEARRPDPGVRTRPARGQVGVDGRVPLALPRQRLLQPEQR